ncbi:RagB/SusD family nutrient uptake outer membrane protein [Rufibacter soli]
MKNRFIRSIARAVPVVLIGLSIFSCNDMLDLEPETALDESKAYQNIFDADAAIIGVYGKFINLAERHVVLNELRADLVSVTGNAASNADLMQLNYHTVQPENKYANPRPYYEVIINCNDVLHNFNKMVADNKITRAEYNERYSDVAALRSWIYLQLGIQYGRVPYITDPLAKVTDLTDQSKFQKIDFEVLLDSLITFTEKIPHKELYSTGSSLLINIGGYNSQKFFVNKRLVLGDLHLWKGNYTQAATHYRKVLETGLLDAGKGARYYDQYRVSWSNQFDPFVGFNGSQSNMWNYEWVWDLPFNPSFSPQNPFVKLFANAGGSYLLKPSQAAISKWAAETRNDLTPGDNRANAAVNYQLGQPVVAKYLQNFSASLPFENKGNWFLARAALVHLRFAEAANRQGHSKLAEAFIQKGVKSVFSDPNLPATNPDVTNTQQTFLPEPFNFDAREGTFPFFRGDWYRHVGLRTRAGLQNINFDDPNASGTLLIRTENAIINEAALELAFEGHRWQDLLRIARRRNDPAFLADKVYEKLVKANDPRAQEVRARLMDPANWYLPFKM